MPTMTKLSGYTVPLSVTAMLRIHTGRVTPGHAVDHAGRLGNVAAGREPVGIPLRCQWQFPLVDCRGCCRKLTSEGKRSGMCEWCSDMIILLVG